MQDEHTLSIIRMYIGNLVLSTK